MVRFVSSDMVTPPPWARRKNPSRASGALDSTRACWSPSVTTSSRRFRRIGSTLTIGSTSSTLEFLQLLDEAEDRVEFVGKRGQVRVFHADTGQLGDLGAVARSMDMCRGLLVGVSAV